MRRGIGTLLFAIAASANAGNACLDVPHTVFARELASAHAKGQLGSLDKKYSELGPFQIYIEHSIAEEDDGTPIFVAAVQSFRELAELLASRQKEGLFPGPQSRPLRQCSNGVCTYDFFTGISHNILYLKEVRYNDYVKCLQLEVIWFLDGD